MDNLFQVINQAGKVVMYTDHQECLPDEVQLTELASAGYKFRLNGKVVSSTKMKDYLQSIKKPKKQPTASGTKKLF